MLTRVANPGRVDLDTTLKTNREKPGSGSEPRKSRGYPNLYIRKLTSFPFDIHIFIIDIYYPDIIGIDQRPSTKILSQGGQIRSSDPTLKKKKPPDLTDSANPVLDTYTPKSNIAKIVLKTKYISDTKACAKIRMMNYFKCQGD